MVGYVVKYDTVKFYTYNRVMAIKMAQKHNGTVKKANEKEIKKAIDVTV